MPNTANLTGVHNLAYDVFLSYARQDMARAEQIKDLLEGLGLTVFFDIDGLDGGDVFPDVLDREVKRAGAVVGVWSRHALSRPWVKIECDIGRERGVLLPIQIEDIPKLDRPAAFWNIQFDDLSDFIGNIEHAGWLKFIRGLARTLDREDLLEIESEKLEGTEGTADRTVLRELVALRSELKDMRSSRERTEDAELNVEKQVSKTLVSSKSSARRSSSFLRYLACSIGFFITGWIGSYAWTFNGGEFRWWSNEEPQQTLIESVYPWETLTQQDWESLDDLSLINKGMESSLTIIVQNSASVDPNAAGILGLIHFYGQFDLQKDYIAASRYFQFACQSGIRRACVFEALALKERYFNEGRSVIESAYDVLKSQCDSDYPLACEELGLLRYYDQYGLTDILESANLFEKACFAGRKSACRAGGRFFIGYSNTQKPELTTTLNERGDKLLSVGCDFGDQLSCSLISPE